MGLKNNINVGVSGHFKIEKTGADGEVLETYEFDNLVLDSGLTLLVTQSPTEMSRNCYIGTGNSSPQNSQTSLDSLLAAVNRSAVASLGAYEGCQRAYKYTYKFSSSAVSGNITEIGTGTGSNNLFNRQLIKDGEGNPTSITVLEQEGLNVYFIIKTYFNLNYTKQSSFVFNDTTYDVYAKTRGETAFINFYRISGVGTGPWGFFAPGSNLTRKLGIITFTATIGSGEGSALTISSSKPLSLQADFQTIAIDWYTEPALTKDIYHSLTMTFTITVGRYGE